MKHLFIAIPLLFSTFSALADQSSQPFLQCSGTYEGQEVSAQILQARDGSLFIARGVSGAIGFEQRPEQLFPVRGIPGSVAGGELYQSDNYQLAISRAENRGFLISLNDTSWSLACL